jgi:3-oxoadipate enol-lactonase
VGEEDTITPVEEAQAIADAVPRGKLVKIPAAGHLSNLEQPARFNGALASFLAALDRG